MLKTVKNLQETRLQHGRHDQYRYINFFAKNMHRLTQYEGFWYCTFLVYCVLCKCLSLLYHKSSEASITSLLPLLRDPAHSVATVRHVVDQIKQTVSFLNPGQVPIMTADQPIYAVAKQVQWHWPEQYGDIGDDKFIIMFGGLHIEMAALKSIGSLLKESG